jgi:octaprenyl-diphosphate synthase
MGARYPAGHEEIGASLRAYGGELGLSFQIVDDCLDLTADEAELGKSAGTDVEDGKVTLPVLYTYKHADEALRAKIREVFTRPGLDQRALRLREACDLKPGLDYAYARAEALIESARACLARLPESASRASREALTGFVLARRS